MALFSIFNLKAKLSSPVKSTVISEQVIESFWLYDDITLKLYFQIADNGNVLLLQKDGLPNKDKCLEVWEEIIKQNALVNNSNDYSNHLDNYKSFAKLNRDYLYVKAMLLRMSLMYSEELRKELHLLGYSITSNTNKQEFETSLLAADRKSQNLITKIKMKSNDLNKIATKPIKKYTSDKALSQLSVALNLVLPDNITLSLFNEYRQRAKEKQKAVEASRARTYGR